MWHYYIYYRIDPTQAQAAQDAAQRLLSHMQSALNIRGLLRRKYGEENLWMEVYEGIADRHRFESVLEQAERESGILNTLNTGQRRHRECFGD